MGNGLLVGEYLWVLSEYAVDQTAIYEEWFQAFIIAALQPK